MKRNFGTTSKTFQYVPDEHSLRLLIQNKLPAYSVRCIYLRIKMFMLFVLLCNGFPIAFSSIKLIASVRRYILEYFLMETEFPQVPDSVSIIHSSICNLGMVNRACSPAKRSVAFFSLTRKCWTEICGAYSVQMDSKNVSGSCFLRAWVTCREWVGVCFLGIRRR